MWYDKFFLPSLYNFLCLVSLKKDIKKNFQYTEHQKRPTVAKYSPSGNYICSGDAGGNVRIWDTTQETHILKVRITYFWVEKI